jgi:hypothetical protein
MRIHDFELEKVMRSSEMPELVSHVVTEVTVVSSAAKVSVIFSVVERNFFFLRPKVG